mmetsp:Transcript_44177/g.94091  ORF Transcript_44177/g.94091 Transcript_44177/m.94091 type:complete len:209 (+) Transcript_44177:154-780(+)
MQPLREYRCEHMPCGELSCHFVHGLALAQHNALGRLTRRDVHIDVEQWRRQALLLGRSNGHRCSTDARAAALRCNTTSDIGALYGRMGGEALARNASCIGAVAGCSGLRSAQKLLRRGDTWLRVRAGACRAVDAVLLLPHLAPRAQPAWARPARAQPAGAMAVATGAAAAVSRPQATARWAPSRLRGHAAPVLHDGILRQGRQRRSRR